MDFIELGEEQAKVFAYWYFLLRQPEQAAQKAGRRTAFCCWGTAGSAGS